jgi:ribosomal protein S18 acetylase RimI-like enzyme
VHTLSTYAELLAACGQDPVVAHEVGPQLLAPPISGDGAVIFRRESQLGTTGAMALGSRAAVQALLLRPWRSTPGWERERSLTLPRAAQEALTALGGRAAGEWDWMMVRPGDLRARALPAGVEPGPIDRDAARAFVAEHHSARWITPRPVAETWIALREKDGQVVAVGLASATPSGDTRLSSITVDAAYRGRGLGWAVTQALTEVGFARSAAVVLGVERSNPAGQGLYAAIGFRRVHEFVSAILPSAMS